ncbi:MAG: TonB-dependent receptor, partial [Flaviaesturariibacter sp.]|nr:TonB-dependent receptor [Flaviaesturariibacter sp.]
MHLFFSIKKAIHQALFFSLGLLANSAFSQSGVTLKGQVVSAERQPLRGATIALVSPSQKKLQQIVSDSAGRFVLAPTTKGKHSVIVSHAGYLPRTILVEEATDSDLGIIQLALSDTLSGVVVQSKQAIIEVDAGTLTFNVAK